MNEVVRKKNRNSDVILVLKVLPGKKPISTIGLLDPRLFSGENKLHAIMDPQHSLWYFKYDAGILPEPLRQRFTSFTKIIDYAKSYFARRNIQIVEIID